MMVKMQKNKTHGLSKLTKQIYNKLVQKCEKTMKIKH